MSSRGRGRGGISRGGARGGGSRGFGNSSVPNAWGRGRSRGAVRTHVPSRGRGGGPPSLPPNLPQPAPNNVARDTSREAPEAQNQDFNKSACLKLLKEGYKSMEQKLRTAPEDDKPDVFQPKSDNLGSYKGPGIRVELQKQYVAQNSTKFGSAFGSFVAQ